MRGKLRGVTYGNSFWTPDARGAVRDPHVTSTPPSGVASVQKVFLMATEHLLAARRQTNLACLRKFFAALGKQDLTEAHRFCHDDFVLEMPYADPPVRLEGFATYQRYVAAAFETFVFELTIGEVHDCVDPDLLIVEYASAGRATPTGRPYANDYIGLWRFSEGRIRSGREYYNPDAARRALDPTHDTSP